MVKYSHLKLNSNPDNNIVQEKLLLNQEVYSQYHFHELYQKFYFSQLK